MGIKPGKRYRTISGTWRRSEQFDCAIVRLEGTDIDSWGKLELELSETPRKGDHVTIVQHPEGGPKQIAMTANQVRAIDDNHLWYTTDTLPGSSGSPVFNDAWRVVAVHRGVSGKLKTAQGDILSANVGVLAASVAQTLGLAQP